MCKITKVYEIDRVESIIRDLETEGYSVFSAVAGYEKEKKENKDLNINHPQRIVEVMRTYYLVIASK